MQVAPVIINLGVVNVRKRCLFKYPSEFLPPENEFELATVRNRFFFKYPKTLPKGCGESGLLPDVKALLRDLLECPSNVTTKQASF
jgi:hypothetical protein